MRKREQSLLSDLHRMQGECLALRDEVSYLRNSLNNVIGIRGLPGERNLILIEERHIGRLIEKLKVTVEK